MANLENRQYQFDFIKGIAIISVILLYAGISHKYFSSYWIGQSVPLFIAVSCLLGCLSLSKNGSIKNYFAKERVKRTFLRIFGPFILAQILLAAIYVILGNFSIKGFLAGGGIGPGSYYPWVYLQLWILVPFLFYVMGKNTIIGSIVIILVSIGINVLFSTLSSSEGFQIPFISHKREAFVFLYRLCVNRYLFIFPLVYLIVEKRLKYNILLFLGFVGAAYIYLSVYKDLNTEPFFFNSGWAMFEFPSHFYTMLLFIFLYKIYGYIPKIIQDIICRIGKYSWEIFNMQMIYFTINGSLNINKYLNLAFSLFICIVPVCTYEFMKKPIEIDCKYGHST